MTPGPHALSLVTPPVRRIGGYRLEGRIGRGAMGAVYVAEDERNGRRVAIKLLMSDLADDPGTRARFVREARVTAALHHPNIVRVLDFGEDQGWPFIAMELLRGAALPAFLATPRPLDTKLDLLRQMCDGLSAAHARGIVHRDVKPTNVFIQDDGTVTLLDFGIARIPRSQLTAGGSVVGTPEYMSPEQAAGDAVDARSDVFSAGAVAYFALSGRAPFAAPELPQVIDGVKHRDPVALTDADAPSAVRRVVARALAKAPAERYPHAAAMLADLVDAGRVRPSMRARAAAWWTHVCRDTGQSTTEWLMVAGILTAVAVFLVDNVPRALGTFMKAMATSVRTIAP